MGGFRIEGSSSNVVDVNVAGDLKVALSNTPANIGGVRLFSENDDGSVTGVPYLVSPETSLDYRLRVGQDSLLFSDEFNATAQNTANWSYTSTTMTYAQTGGFLVSNSSLSAAITTGCIYQTRRIFTPFNAAALCAESNWGITAVPLAGQEFYFGFGTKTATAVPSDGAFFKLSGAGLMGYISFGGSFIESTVFKTPAQFEIGRIEKYALVMSNNAVQFWCNDVLLAKMDISPTSAQASLMTSLPLIFCQHNTTAIAGSPQMQVKIGNVAVMLMDVSMNRPWAAQMAAMGLMAYQGQNGGTMGQSARWVNATNPVTGVATNTTVVLEGAISAMGGLFLWTLPASSSTDVIIMNFTNPAGSTIQTPGNLIVRGVWMDVTNTVAAVATTATIIPLAIAFGHTAVSLVTADAAATKSPRRLPIGTAAFIVGAQIGENVRISADFETPVVINPGENLAIVAKPFLATAGPSLLFNIGFNAHFE